MRKEMVLGRQKAFVVAHPIYSLVFCWALIPAFVLEICFTET